MSLGFAREARAALFRGFERKGRGQVQRRGQRAFGVERIISMVDGPG